MSKSAKKAADQAEREKVHKRYSNRREPDVIYPAKKQVDFYDADIHQRVAVYVRVSTDNLGQETSYELQKNYYEEFVLKHPNWKLVKIYADKGISGTSTKHRVELNQMLAARKPPVGIYFISEDLYTLASYYRDDLREPCFLPAPDWKILPDDELDVRGALHE